MFGVVTGDRARHAARDEQAPHQRRDATGGGAPGGDEAGDPEAGGTEPPEEREPEHQCTLTFAALPSTPRWARALAREALRGWGLEPLADTAELLLSELVTNAVKATCRDAVIRVTIRAGADRLRIEVTDRGAGRPRVDDPGPETESGRGLLLVSSISADWGTHPVRLPSGASGKVVWCEIPAGEPAAERVD